MASNDGGIYKQNKQMQDMKERRYPPTAHKISW